MKINYIILVLSILFLSSCKKENFEQSPFGGEANFTWEDPGCVGGFDYDTSAVKKTQFEYPVFNPNNKYEFIYYETTIDNISELESYRLIKYNYLYDQKTILLEDVKITGYPTWNKYGWIAFKNKDDLLIYLIDSDGSHLTKFIDIPSGIVGPEENLTWIADGQRLIWGGLDVNSNFYLKHKKINGLNVLDYELGENMVISENFSISKDSVILFPLSNGQFSTTDIKEDSLIWEVKHLSTGEFFFNKVAWHIDNKRFFGALINNPDDIGFYEINYETGEATLLIQLCEREFISGAACSPDGKRLIIQKIERDVVPDSLPVNVDNTIENNSLWLYDFQTGKEVRLPL